MKQITKTIIGTGVTGVAVLGGFWLGNKIFNRGGPQENFSKANDIMENKNNNTGKDWKIIGRTPSFAGAENGHNL